MLYILGSTAAMSWLITGYGEVQVWRALSEVRHLTIGWVANAMFFIALFSPIVTMLLMRDANRHVHRRVPSSFGGRILVDTGRR